MAKPQGKQAFMSSGTSTTTTRDHEQEGYYYENEWGGSSTTGCCCFRLFCFERSRGGDGEGNNLLHDRRGEEKTWFVSNLKKLKEGSEVLAGPKWKNFLRRLGKYFNRRSKSSPSSSSTHHNQFQYDPHSYALNFDDGDQEDGFLLGNYQSRFTAPPSAVS